MLVVDMIGDHVGLTAICSLGRRDLNAWNIRDQVHYS